jgi:hypothetical protein
LSTYQWYEFWELDSIIGLFGVILTAALTYWASINNRKKEQLQSNDVTKDQAPKKSARSKKNRN